MKERFALRSTRLNHENQHDLGSIKKSPGVCGPSYLLRM